MTFTFVLVNMGKIAKVAKHQKVIRIFSQSKDGPKNVNRTEYEF